MAESHVMPEWIAQVYERVYAEAVTRGMLKGRRKNVLRVLQLRFSEQAAAEVAATVEAQTDLDLLAQWFDVAVLAPSWEGFRATTGIQQEGPGELRTTST
jgi:hypothetical protein